MNADVALPLPGRYEAMIKATNTLIQDISRYQRLGKDTLQLAHCKHQLVAWSNEGTRANCIHLLLLIISIRRLEKQRAYSPWSMNA